MSEVYLAENFLLENSFCVLAVSDAEGKPHASMMHFAVGEDPLFDIYFATSPESRKVSMLASGTANASLVVGSSDSWKTLQMDGVLRKVSDPKEMQVARDALYAKYPNDRYHEMPGVVFMHFKASWYRYGDFTTEPPLVIPWSDQEVKKGPFNPD